MVRWSTSDSVGSRCFISFCRNMKPTVLLATTSRWYPTARLAMALASAGCKVEAVCPAGHPIAQDESCPSRRMFTAAWRHLVSLARAISIAQPDFIVSGDDLATQHLHRLYAQEKRSGKRDSPICALIERSLGSPESFPIVSATSRFHERGARRGRSRSCHSSHLATSMT